MGLIGQMLRNLAQLTKKIQTATSNTCWKYFYDVTITQHLLWRLKFHCRWCNISKTTEGDFRSRTTALTKSIQSCSSKLLSIVVIDVAIGLIGSREVGLTPGPVKSNTVSNGSRCAISSELCCSDAKPRKWNPSLFTRFGVIPRV